MSLLNGTHLGRYQIVGLLGSGGMGEVYRARDTQLHRDVALKVLPESVAGDTAAEARFEREARAIASVNHPNICAVHDVGVHAGRRFLVMELLEGETLQQRLSRGAFEIPELLEHGIALADALHAAHAREIIHRDLKPANIFLTTRGQPKILDFGLARAIYASDTSTRAADTVITGHGTALGTAAYMSPEQLRGESLDGRTDVFSLGLVLYEMATAQRAFSGSTGAAVGAVILNDDVRPPGAVRADLPPQIDTAILKALEKDRDLRYQSAADLRADLKRIKKHISAQQQDSGRTAARKGGTSDATGTPVRLGTGHSSSSSDVHVLSAIIWRHRVWAAGAAAVVVLALAAAVWLRSDTDESRPPIAGPGIRVEPLTLDGQAARGTISPDGRFLVYEHHGEGGVRVRQVSGETDIALVPPGRFSRIASLTVTPDGNAVDIVAVTGAALKPDAWRVPLLGGNPRKLLENVGSAIGWSPDGRTMAFLRFDATSGEASVLMTDADGSRLRTLARRRAPKMLYGDFTAASGHPSNRPAWSPDGELLIVAGYSSDTMLDYSELITLDAKSGAERQSVRLPGEWKEVAWLDDTRLLLNGGFRAGAVGSSSLWVSDLAGRQVTPVTREFGLFGGMSVTADRTVAVASRFTRLTGIWVSDASGRDAKIVVPVSAAGASLPALDAAGGMTYTLFRADGANAVYYQAGGTSRPVQIVDSTPIPSAGRFHDVSADGRMIVYSEMAKPHGLIRVQKDGSGQVRLVESDTRVPRLTPDGKTVVFARRAPGLYSVPITGGPVRPLADRVIPDGGGNRNYRGVISVSPDGTRVLFNTHRAGVVSVCNLPDCSNLQDLPLASSFWAPDGAGVAYVQNEVTIMEQPLSGGAPRPIVRLEGSEPVIDFRWSPDGSRLVTARGRSPNDVVIIRGLR